MAILTELSLPDGISGDCRSGRLRPGSDCCEALERGEIVLLCGSTQPVPNSSWEVLRRIPARALKHKNISYDPATDRISGMVGQFEIETALKALRSYCESASWLCEILVAPYSRSWQVDLTSFRPLEESTRKLPARQRNDRLHIDSFPSRPTNGARILRCFTNIHPSRSRVWITGEPLNCRAQETLAAAGLEQIEALVRGQASIARRTLRRLGRIAGISWAARSPYDRFMLRLHDYMKSSASYYCNARATRHEFPPGSTWLVFTDAVPHAVLEGQYALEQTFLVQRSALVRPDEAPIAFFERLSGSRMTV